MVSHRHLQAGWLGLGLLFRRHIRLFIDSRFGDRYERKLAVIMGSLFALLGGALQAGPQHSDMAIYARVIAGIGTGFMNSVGTISTLLYSFMLFVLTMPIDHPSLGL